MSGLVGKGKDVTSGFAGEFQPGSVVRCHSVHDHDAASHISTTSTSLVTMGITVTSPAVENGNYNIITFHPQGQLPASDHVAKIACFYSHNGGTYTNLVGGSTHAPIESEDAHMYSATFIWVDVGSAMTGGDNSYRMYMATAGGTFYAVHSSFNYTLMVQEIKG